MARIALIAACLILFALPAAAQEQNDDVLNGFKLGKLYVNCVLLGFELHQIVDTNTKLHSDDYEWDDASRDWVVYYVLTRVDGMVKTICDEGLTEEAFTHPAELEYKPELTAILEEVREVSESFLLAPDLSALERLAFQISDRELDTQLFDMARQLQEQVGEETGVHAEEVTQ